MEGDIYMIGICRDDIDIANRWEVDALLFEKEDR